MNKLNLVKELGKSRTIDSYLNQADLNAGRDSTSKIDKEFTSEMNKVDPTTSNYPFRSAYSTLSSTDTEFCSIRQSCQVRSLPSCTIGAETAIAGAIRIIVVFTIDVVVFLPMPIVMKNVDPGSSPCCQIS